MDKKSILSEIKNLLFSNEAEVVETKFVDAKVGDAILRVEGDAFAPGLQVSIVTEDGVIPAGAELAGEHLLEDGTKITLDESGVITEVEAPETEVEVEEDLGKKEKMADETEKKDEEEMAEDTEKEDKIAALEKRIEEMESVIEKMMGETEKYNNFSNALIEKIEDLMKNTPAELEFASIKSEYSQLVDNKRTSARTNLESIRNLRKK